MSGSETLLHFQNYTKQILNLPGFWGTWLVRFLMTESEHLVSFFSNRIRPVGLRLCDWSGCFHRESITEVFSDSVLTCPSVLWFKPNWVSSVPWSPEGRPVEKSLHSVFRHAAANWSGCWYLGYYGSDVASWKTNMIITRISCEIMFDRDYECSHHKL